MTDPAEFCTDPGISAGSVGADDDAIGDAGDCIHFAAKPWRPKTMDHINAGDRDFNSLSSRNIEPVHDCSGTCGRVARKLPAPLFCLRLNHERCTLVRTGDAFAKNKTIYSCKGQKGHWKYETAPHKEQPQGYGPSAVTPEGEKKKAENDEERACGQHE